MSSVLRNAGLSLCKFCALASTDTELISVSLSFISYNWLNIFAQKSTISDSNITPQKFKFRNDSSLLVSHQWTITAGHLGITGVTSKKRGDKRNKNRLIKPHKKGEIKILAASKLSIKIYSDENTGLITNRIFTRSQYDALYHRSRKNK